MTPQCFELPDCLSGSMAFLMLCNRCRSGCLLGELEAYLGWTAFQFIAFRTTMYVRYAAASTTPCSGKQRVCCQACIMCLPSHAVGSRCAGIYAGRRLLLVGMQYLAKVACQTAVAAGLPVPAPFSVVLRNIKYFGVGAQIPQLLHVVGLCFGDLQLRQEGVSKGKAQAQSHAAAVARLAICRPACICAH